MRVLIVMLPLSLAVAFASGCGSEPRMQRPSPIVRAAAAGRPSLPERIASLVSRLSWESVHGNCEGLLIRFRPSGDAADELIKIGKPASAKLIQALEDPDKGVASHLIL